MELKDAVATAKEHVRGLHPDSGEAKALTVLIDRCDANTPALGQLSISPTFGAATTRRQRTDLRAVNHNTEAARILAHLNRTWHFGTSLGKTKPESADMIRRGINTKAERNTIARRLGDLEALGYVEAHPDACTSERGITCKGYLITDKGIGVAQALRRLEQKEKQQ